MKCSVGGCDKPQRGLKPLCNMHLIRLRKTGSVEESPRALSRRQNDECWRAMLEASSTDGPCIEWPGSRSPKGYGLRKRNGEHSVTRAFWVEVNGPIPNGLYVLHRCDNPPCGRLAHLFLGTPKDNTVDMVRKGRSLARFSDAQVAEILAAHASQETFAAIARRYDVSYQTISNICAGRRYAHRSAA